MGGGLRLGAIDGTVTRMPDTAANRAAFGTAGQAETGYPQIRHLHQLRPMAEDSPAAAGLNILPGASDPDVATPPPRSMCPKRLSVASAARS